MIDNAAREPEVVDLAALLIKMGASIEGAGTSTIRVQGVDETARRRTHHYPGPDRGRDVPGGGRDHAGRSDGDRLRRRSTLRALIAKLHQAART